MSKYPNPTHRPVIGNDKETTKIRAVFDLKVSGPSLNECLYSGPNLFAKIFSTFYFYIWWAVMSVFYNQQDCVSSNGNFCTATGI